MIALLESIARTSLVLIAIALITFVPASSLRWTLCSCSGVLVTECPCAHRAASGQGAESHAGGFERRATCCGGVVDDDLDSKPEPSKPEPRDPCCKEVPARAIGVVGCGAAGGIVDAGDSVAWGHGRLGAYADRAPSPRSARGIGQSGDRSSHAQRRRLSERAVVVLLI